MSVEEKTGAHAAPVQPKPKHGRRIAVALIAVVVLLGIAYAAGYYYFGTHFVPGTTVNGTDVSNLDEAALAARADEAGEGWKAALTGADGFSLAVAASDIDLTVDGEALAEAAKAETDPAYWLYDLVEPQEIVTDEAVTYDEDKLSQVVNAAVEDYNATAQGPTDAAPAYDEAEKKFTVTPETPGTQLNAEAVEAAASEAVYELKDEVELTDDALVQPKVTADNDKLVDAVEKANGMLALDIPLTANGKEAAHVTGEVAAGWITFGDGFAVSLDTDAITSWANDQLAASVARTDETHVYGIDAAAAAAAIADALQNGKTDPIEVPTTVLQELPPATEGASKLGRHIDVNLTTQFARMYDDGGNVIWYSYIVSGNTGEGRSTPTGTFAINSGKGRNQTLVGMDENGDGEPDYESKVTYWMPFVGNAVGLHDASWRSKFGGTIYQWNGSHGCVNLPTAKAAELYDLTRVGDKVIVHW